MNIAESHITHHYFFRNNTKNQNYNQLHHITNIAHNKNSLTLYIFNSSIKTMKFSTTSAALLCLLPGAVVGLSSPNPAIKAAAQGMSLLKPIFKAEAELQAAALGALAGVDKASVAQEIEENKKKNKVLIYTYGLSPFSTEATSLLEDSEYEFTTIELGKEWFLLGGEASETRVALAKEIESGATSLPKIFIGGECIGGCAELATIVENGELDGIMKKAGVSKKGEEKKKGFSFGGFSL